MVVLVRLNVKNKYSDQRVERPVGVQWQELQSLTQIVGFQANH